MKKAINPFAVLGIHPDASLEDVKRAYRRLAMRWHPDRNPTATAEAEFKRIKAAYETILDPQQHAQWQRDEAPAEASAEAADDTAAPGDDVTQALILTLEEAAHGCSKRIDLVKSSRCSSCHGNGRVRHAHSVPCAQCNGVGRVRGDSRGTRLCEGCGGRGYLRETDCSECAGSGWRKKQRTLSVKVPAGTLHGERLRLARQARHGPEGEGAAGDLYLEIRLAEHALFALRQRDLHCTVPLSIFRLLRGGQVEIPTLDGGTTLDLSPAPAHGPEYRLPGRGFPNKHGRGAGDLVVHLQPVYPSYFSAGDSALLERLDASLSAELERRAPQLAEWAELLRTQQNS